MSFFWLLTIISLFNSITIFSMKMEEKDNPNSNSHDTSKYKSWSDLPLDLSSSILERLGFADFRRAKSVCSSWHAASKQSVPKKNQIHWLILFPKDNNSCTLLFNPEEKDNKLYKTRDLRFEESVCLATYGNWLLMTREYKYFYIVNLFTKEMINVPPYNDVSIQRSYVFWIDEKTKDYVVLFGRYRRHENLDVFYCSSKKKQDDDGNNNNLSWNQIPETSHCINLVYKDHKLYFLSLYGIFRIFDFSSSCENPKQIFACGCPVEKLRLGMPRPTRIVVSVRKDQEVIFKVEMFSRRRSKNWHFRVFMIYSSGFLKIPEMVDSLGDEAVLFDQGITVLAAANEGFIRRNSIYFSDRHDNIYVFSLETQKTELLHTFDFSSVQFSSARWFLPSF